MRRVGSNADFPKVELVGEDHSDVKTPMARRDSAKNLKQFNDMMSNAFVEFFNKNPDHQVSVKMDPNGGGFLVQAKKSALTE